VSAHDQFRELIEGYALGSLDEQERASLDVHLAAGCPECAKALEESRWLVTQLVYLAPPAQPSDMLRARLLQKVRAEAGAGRANAPAGSGLPWWLWAGVAALLLVTVYSTWNAQRMQKEIQALNEHAAAELKQREQLQQELTTAKREARILMDPSSKKIMLPPSSPDMPMLEAMWHPELGICVVGRKVPMPGKNRVLQLWLLPKTPGGKPMPSQMTWPDADGKLDLLVANPPDHMWNTKALAITEEPAGGSAQPTSTPMWVGGVS
jgi:anti-sigma-K factor RskA